MHSIGTVHRLVLFTFSYQKKMTSHLKFNLKKEEDWSRARAIIFCVRLCASHVLVLAMCWCLTSLSSNGAAQVQLELERNRIFSNPLNLPWQSEIRIYIGGRIERHTSVNAIIQIAPATAREREIAWDGGEERGWRRETWMGRGRNGWGGGALNAHNKL